MGDFPATRKLFDADAYAVEFEAKILSAEKEDHGGIQTWSLILDRTLFFPEEGGQTPDRGEIDGFPVTDVQLEGDVIRHRIPVPDSAKRTALDTVSGEDPDPEESLPKPAVSGEDPDPEETLAQPAASLQRPAEAPLFARGQTVRGRIDFARRFSNMQNHSGEHILSGLVHKRFGYDNVGFHLSDNTVTLDFNGPLTDDDIVWLENAANRVVWKNREIRGWYPDPGELERAAYRSKKEIDGPLRLVEIRGVDLCACCAPHVRRTGEIGIIKILRTLRERGGIRLTILCGSRALACLQAMQKAAEEVSHLTNMPREEIAPGVSRILEENEKLRQRGAQLEFMVTEALAAAVPQEEENVFLFTDGIGNLAQRRLVNDLCRVHRGYCGVFVGTGETGYRYIIGAGTDSGQSREAEHSGGAGQKKDARVLNAGLQNACGARGGGKPAMVQGSVTASKEDIEKALDQAIKTVAKPFL